MGNRIFRLDRSNPKSNLYVMMLSGAIWTPISTAMGIYWQIYLTMLGASPIDIAIIAMSSTMVLTFSRFLGGYLADVIGRRKLIVSMTYAVSVCYLAMFFATTWKIILLTSIFLNIFLLYQPATEAIIADSTSDGARGKNYGTLNLVPGIMILFSPIIAYMFISRYGITWGTRILILLTAIAGFIVGILRTFTLKETIDQRDSSKVSNGGILSQYRHVFGIIKKRMFALFVFIMLLGVVGGLTMMTQLYVIIYLGSGNELWALLRFMYLLTFVVFIIPAGVATDHYGRKNVILIGTILSIFSITFLLLASLNYTEIFLLFYSILGSISWALLACSIPSMEADILPKNIRGKAYAVIAAANSIALAFSQLFCGYIYVYGENIPYLLALFVLVFMAIIMARISEK